MCVAAVVSNEHVRGDPTAVVRPFYCVPSVERDDYSDDNNATRAATFAQQFEIV